MPLLPITYECQISPGNHRIHGLLNMCAIQSQNPISEVCFLEPFQVPITILVRAHQEKDSTLKLVLYGIFNKANTL